MRTRSYHGQRLAPLLDNQTFRTRLHEGAPVMVVFLRGLWCDYCRKQATELVRLIPAFEGHTVQVLAVTTDAELANHSDYGALHTFLDEDGSIVRQLELNDPFEFRDVPVPLPATFLLDASGVVRFHHVGRSPDDRPRPELLLLAAERLSTEMS